MEPLQSENCLPTLGSMLDPKFSTTNSNTAKDGVMSTQIENIVNELTELVVQKVLEEFNQRIDEVARRLGEMERALAAQPMVDANFVDERVKTWVDRNLHEVIVEIVDNYDIDYKIQSAIEDTDLDDAIKEAVYERIDDELESKGFIDEEDLQRYLDHYRFVTEGSLIEFLNDRVRFTVE